MCEIMDRWMNELRAEGYKNGEAVGFANGEAAGFANGQNCMAVQIYQDLGRSKAETSDYLVHTLHITRDQADKAVEQYWRS